ncbi:MAG: CPBP family intramembrane metalloprotease [Treponema sp.]|nr:CPBP family intramembrane metalloprotease [Candidatus Treponema caballi]
MSVFISELIGALLQLVLFAFIPFIWWLVSARKRKGFLSWIGLKRVQVNGKWSATLLVTLGAVVCYGLLTKLVTASVSEGITTAGSSFAGMGVAALPAVFVYGFIRTGLSEEIVFRGFILKRISDKWGFTAGNIIQALLFGALHGVPFGLATQNVWITIIMTLLPGAFGWFQGWLNEKRSGGSIIPSWLLHGIINTLVAALSL